MVEIKKLVPQEYKEVKNINELVKLEYFLDTSKNGLEIKEPLQMYTDPFEFDQIALVTKRVNEEDKDTIMCWDERGYGYLFIGKWNVD